MKGKINEKSHDMIAYSYANFGMVKKITQRVEAIFSTESHPKEENEKGGKSIDLFEEEIYLHFY